MSRYLPAFTYLNQDVTSGDPATIKRNGCMLVGPDASGLSFTQEWTGTLAGTVKVEATSSPKAFPNNPQTVIDAAPWKDVTSDFALTDPTTGGGNDTESVSNVRFEYLRISLTGVTGTGNYKLHVSGQDD